MTASRTDEFLEDAGLDQDLALRLSAPQLTHDGAQIALSAAFDASSVPARSQLYDWLDEAARTLFGYAEAELHEQAQALSRTLGRSLELQPELEDYRGLLLGHLVRARRGHPMLLAVIAHEVARRAGFSSVVARDQQQYWTVLKRDDMFIPIGFGSASQTMSPDQLRACCPHQVAYSGLKAIADYAPARYGARADRVLAMVAIDPHHIDR